VSALTERLPRGPDREWVLLKRIMREASALGTEFRITGADVEISSRHPLPPDLEGLLAEAREHGLLHSYLGAENTDLEACAFLERLGIEPVLVTGADAAVSSLREIAAEKSPILGVDIETCPKPEHAKPKPAITLNADGSLRDQQPRGGDEAALDPHRGQIATLQVYAGGTLCYVFRGAALRRALASPWLRAQRMVSHNSGFETRFLSPDRPLECSMQATGLIIGVGYEGEKRRLENAAKEILGVQPPKGLALSNWAAPSLSRGQLAYACSDAILSYKLWGKLRVELQRTGRVEAYRLQRDAILPIAAMETRGIGFDLTEHGRLCAEWSRDLSEARRAYTELTGTPPPSKPAETREWLATVVEDLASWPRTTKTGLLSTEEKDLKRLTLSDVPTVRPVLEILARQKLLANFGPRLSGFVNPVTGRIHASYNVAATKGGRCSSSSPNAQQWPGAKWPLFKRCIVPGPGHLLVVADWSLMELRAAAWFSRDRTMLEVFRAGRDLHRESAAGITGLAYEAVSPEQRQAAKPVNFGAIYGVGPKTLAENAFCDYGVDMSEAEAKDALDRFFRRFRDYDRWRWANYRAIQACGRVKTLSGRTVEAAWEFGGKISFPQCCNLPIQGSCADAMLRAIPAAHSRLRELGGFLVAVVHDEVVAEVPEDRAEAAKAILVEVMTEAFLETFPGSSSTRLVCAGAGVNWYAAKRDAG